METLGLHGKLLSLIKNIYKSTKCAVKCDDKTTQFFDFTKGVRQGCPLSPILFNLYVNDIFEMINSSMKTPIYLNENNKVNAIMFADDLLIIAQSEVELQSSATNCPYFAKTGNSKTIQKTRNVWFSIEGINYAKLTL